MRAGMTASVATRLDRSVAAAVAVLAALALGGCGSSDETTDGTAADTPAASAPPPATSAPAATADPAAASEIMDMLTGMGAAERWAIRDVVVEDGAVTVHTDLYPDAEAEPAVRGACTFVGPGNISSVDVTGVTVLAQDDSTVATWTAGDPACELAGRVKSG
jgi:hypothetical protein